jgi:hypothetical protein
MAQSLFDRYINNDLLRHLSRPQHPGGCSIASLATAFNCLFAVERGLMTQEDVAAALGLDGGELGIQGGPGNEVLLEWFRRLVAKRGLDADCGVLVNHEDVNEASRNDEIFEELKAVIRGPDTALVYHLEHHYNIICGYFENAASADEAYSASASIHRWLILADPSSTRDPIWSIRWQDICHDLLHDPRHCILAFSRTA